MDPSPSRLHVVYYLSRSGHLEHPHLLEVTVSSADGLRLRDVKKRLALIRGKSLASSFAWSYKRSYKNGYVWQDVCDDDLVLPAHGSEYILKGSEIVAELLSEKYPQYDADTSSTCVNEDRKLNFKGLAKPCAVIHSNAKHLPEAINSANFQASKASKEISSSNLIANRVQQSHFEFSNNNADSSSKDSHSTDEELMFHANRHTAQYSSSSSDVAPKHRSTCTSLLTDAEVIVNTSDEDIRSVKIHGPLSSSMVKGNGKVSGTLHRITVVECGTDAATQTDEDPVSIHGQADGKKITFSTVEEGQEGKPTVLHKGEIISPPSSSSTVSPSTSTLSDHSHHGMHGTPSNQTSQAMPHLSPSIEEENADELRNGIRDTTSPLRALDASTPRKAGGLLSVCFDNSLANQTLDTEATSTRPLRAKHLGALSLLQFVSCGGLDVKEQILPMSTIYNLKSTTTNASTPMSVHTPPRKLGTYISDGHHHQHSLSSVDIASQVNSMTSCNINSIDNDSSMSDRSNKLSRELGFQADHAHSCHEECSCKDLQVNGKNDASLSNTGSRAASKLTLMEHIDDQVHVQYRINDSHPLSTACSPSKSKQNTQNASNRRTVSGEVFGGSPLFEPGASATAHMRQQRYQHDQQHHYCHPIHVANTTVRKGMHLSPTLVSITPIKAQHQMCSSEIMNSPTKVYRALTTSPNNNLKENTAVSSRLGGSVLEKKCDERTLQHAVGLSLPPLELLVLHECPHCGRKLKPEALKSHMKACSSTAASGASSPLKPLKSGESHGNLYHRFLKASSIPSGASTAACRK